MRKDASTLWVAGAFVGVVASFLAATAYSEHRARAIHGAATSIARKAAPSIQLLATLRTELRELANLAAEGALTRQDRDELRRSRDRISDTLAAYLALGAYPDEAQVARELRSSVRSLQAALERLLAAAEPAVGTGEGLEPWLLRAQTAAYTALDLNATEAGELALRIDATRQKAGRLALGLDGLAIVLAVLAAWLALRAIRRGTRALVEQRDELDVFAGRVAHDVLGPLSSARLWIDTAIRRAAKEGRQDAALERAVQTLGQGGTIVQELLEFARAGARPDRRAVVDLATVLPGAVAELRPEAEAAQAELEIDVPARCPVRCTAGACASILSNLVRNAFKYLGDAPVRRVEVRARCEGPRVIVEVADSGPGIPLDKQVEVFEPFVRAATGGRSGLGLGLATVKRLVEGYGGQVGLRSEPGRGALFWFELPAADEEPAR